MHDVYEWLRYVNLTLTALLTVAMLSRWGAFLRALIASRYGRLALFAWVSSTLYGTAESLHMHVPAGPRVPTVTSVTLLTVVYAWKEVKYDRRARAAAQQADS
jgi:hypothetical protein